VFLRDFFNRAKNPARIVLTAYLGFITVGTALLFTPAAIDGPQGLSFTDALFTATSSVTVTGLSTVDISVFSLFGELVILALIQIGGFGIMTIASIAILITSRRVSLRQRMVARAEIASIDIGELRPLIIGIAKFTLLTEAIVALLLFIRFSGLIGDSVPGSAYSAIFHAISGFNNAGVALYSDNLEQFARDPFVLTTLSIAFIIGGLGFPVLIELRRRLAPRQWSLHTKITLSMSAILLVVAPIIILALEWDNSRTFGQMSTVDKLFAGWFTGSSPRTAGFNIIPTGELTDPTLLVITTLMFIGAGTASTSGGIKVVTFAILAFVLLAEVRGDSDVNVFKRRLSPTVIRRAITVALLGVGLVVSTSIVLESISSFELTDTIFEVTSAFGTVGLSTGITADLPTAGHLILAVIMLAGRVGLLTFVTALALRRQPLSYRFPEEQPIID
jgi:potassium uptake TrkH family protein